jgi:hypothetical protein
LPYFLFINYFLILEIIFADIVFNVFESRFSIEKTMQYPVRNIAEIKITSDGRLNILFSIIIAGIRAITNNTT